MVLLPMMFGWRGAKGSFNDSHLYAGDAVLFHFSHRIYLYRNLFCGQRLLLLLYGAK